MDQSSWFVLLLSEDAAGSVWVDREVAWWLEHKDASRIIPVVTDGELAGIVSIGDVVKNRLEEVELEANVLRDAYIAAR